MIHGYSRPSAIQVNLKGMVKWVGIQPQQNGEL